MASFTIKTSDDNFEPFVFVFLRFIENTLHTFLIHSMSHKFFLNNALFVHPVDGEKTHESLKRLFVITKLIVFLILEELHNGCANSLVLW